MSPARAFAGADIEPAKTVKQIGAVLFAHIGGDGEIGAVQFGRDTRPDAAVERDLGPGRGERCHGGEREQEKAGYMETTNAVFHLSPTFVCMIIHYGKNHSNLK